MADDKDPIEEALDETNPFTPEVEQAGETFSPEMQKLDELEKKMDDYHREVLEAIAKTGRLG